MADHPSKKGSRRNSKARIEKDISSDLDKIKAGEADRIKKLIKMRSDAVNEGTVMSSKRRFST